MKLFKVSSYLMIVSLLVFIVVFPSSAKVNETASNDSVTKTGTK